MGPANPGGSERADQHQQARRDTECEISPVGLRIEHPAASTAPVGDRIARTAHKDATNSQTGEGPRRSFHAAARTTKEDGGDHEDEPPPLDTTRKGYSRKASHHPIGRAESREPETSGPKPSPAARPADHHTARLQHAAASSSTERTVLYVVFAVATDHTAIGDRSTPKKPVSPPPRQRRVRSPAPPEMSGRESQG